MNVVAVATVPANDSSLQNLLAGLRAPDATHGHTVVDFPGADALIERLRALVLERGECIEVLEIAAHGTAGKLDGLVGGNIQHFGDELNRLNRMCRNCKIYLTGCNTALTYPRGTMFPLPRMLAMSTRCTVYASVGYQTGTHAQGTARATPTCTYNGRLWEKMPGCPIDGEVTGDACYQAFTP